MATVVLTVAFVNHAPVAVADAATTAEDTAVTIAVLANDTDRDDDALSIRSVGAALHGTVVIVGQQVTYTPAANYNGADTFTYVATDGHGANATRRGQRDGDRRQRRTGWRPTTTTRRLRTRR